LLEKGTRRLSTLQGKLWRFPICFSTLRRRREKRHLIVQEGAGFITVRRREADAKGRPSATE